MTVLVSREIILILIEHELTIDKTIIYLFIYFWV